MKEDKREYKTISIEDKFKMLAAKSGLKKDNEFIDLKKIQPGEIKFTYHITIDFKIIYEFGWFELDLIDLALFQIIARLLHFTKQPPKYVDGLSGTWFVLTEERIMLECPFIPLSSITAIRKRMKKLEERKLLTACPKNEIHRFKYFRLGENAELLCGSTKKSDYEYDLENS